MSETTDLLVALSVGVQIVGAFFFPCDWTKFSFLKNPDLWLWNWRNPEILHCLSVGLEKGPQPFVFLDFIGA